LNLRRLLFVFGFTVQETHLFVEDLTNKEIDWILATSSEYRSKFGTPPTNMLQPAVKYLYEAILRRSPTTSDTAHHVGEMARGNGYERQRHIIQNSDEARNAGSRPSITEPIKQASRAGINSAYDEAVKACEENTSSDPTGTLLAACKRAAARARDESLGANGFAGLDGTSQIRGLSIFDTDSEETFTSPIGALGEPVMVIEGFDNNCGTCRGR